MATSPTPKPEPFIVERTMVGGTHVTIRCADHHGNTGRDIQGATIDRGASHIELSRDELYRLADIIAIADAEEWTRRFPCEDPAHQDEGFPVREIRPWDTMLGIQRKVHLDRDHDMDAAKDPAERTRGHDADHADNPNLLHRHVPTSHPASD